MNFLFNINVCRVCMQNEETSDLFKDKNLLEKFTYTTRLTISEEDNLPKVICNNCTVRLKIAHKFVQTAHESENNLKKFLAKISNEFKEVTQSNKQDRSKDKNESSSDQNLTKDEMLTLIGEDKTSDRRSSISTSKRKVKRKTSPIKEPPSKNPKSENKNKENNVVKSHKTPNSSQKLRNSANDEAGYSLREDVLILQSKRDELEFENDNDTHFSEEEDEQEDDKLQEEIDDQLNQNEEDTIQEDTLQDKDQDLDDAENHESRVTLEDHDQDKDYGGNPDTRDKEQDETKNHDTQMFTINDDSSQSSKTELTELILDENQLHHQSLDEHSTGIENIETEQDGYLREYETMLNSHENDLQYHSDYAEDNSSDETPLKEDTIYIPNIEEDQETYNIADVGDEDNLKKDYPSPISPHATRSQRDKVTTKLSLRKESNQQLHRFYCEQCNRDFSTKTNLNRHMQSHEGNKPYVCQECSKSFSQKSTLKQHMYTHTGERPYVCDVCDRGFTQCKSLIFHMRRHTGEKPFQCEYCMILFRQKDALRAVDYTVVGDDMSFFQPCDKGDNDGNTNLADFAELYLTHEYAEDLETIKTNGNITITVDIPPDENILIEIEVLKWRRGQWVNTIYSIRRTNGCASAFDPREFWYSFIMQLPEEERICPPKKDMHILKYHVITEKLPNGKETYSCIICQKKFNAKSAFKIHMKLHTAITEPENMELITNESIENVTAVKQRRGHHSSSQGSIQSMFLEDENLDAAVMNVSASSASEPRRAKKFQCRKCFKCFALKKSLIRHMSIHYTNVEEDITECSDCDLQFDNAGEYQEHLTEHHQFACSACPHLIFKTIQDLKIHMIEHDLDHQEQVQEEFI